MLIINYNTQGVEAINKTCSTYAIKGETYSKTMSLTARLQIACAAQILGHHALWKRIFDSVGLPVGNVLSTVLKKKIMIKRNNIWLEGRKKYKTAREVGWTKNSKFCVKNK